MSGLGPRNPLTVSAPPAPRGRINLTQRTSVRLARNTAVLFGVDVPDAAAGSTARVSDYNALTSADVGRGAPADAQRPDEIPIASATLSKYGPETKAALVLTGANELFASVEETMREVLRLVGQSEDAGALADSMRITAWAALLLDVYETQPALLVAALQARAVQRGALIDWAPWVDEDAAPRSDSVEFGTVRNRAGSAGDRSREAKTLDIFDGLMSEEVHPLALTGDYEASNALLADDLVDRFAGQLLRGSMESGLARLTVDRAGRKRIDVALSRLSLLVAFTEANMQTYYMVAPYKESGPSRRRRDDREPYNPKDRAHWRRLLPRIPTKPELARLDTDVAYEAIRTLTIMLRVLRVTRKGPREMRTTCRGRLGELATVAEEFFGADSYPALEARAAHLAAVASDLRYREPKDFDAPYDSTLEAGRALFEVYGQVRDRYRDLMKPGAWLEFMDMLSPRIGAWARETTDAGDVDRGRAIQRQLCEDWEDAFTRLGIDPLTRQPHILRERCQGLVAPLDNWVALAIRMTDDPKLYSRALLMAREVVVPIRRDLAIRRGNDRPYRRTLEEVALGICDGIASLAPGEASDALNQLEYVGQELRRTSRIEQLLGDTTYPPGSELNERDAIAAVTLVRTYATLDEHNMSPNGLLTSDEIGRLLEIAHSALSEVAESSQPKRSRVLSRLDELASQRAAPSAALPVANPSR